MPNKLELLTTRNAIFASSAVLLLSVVVTCISMLRPRDSGGLGRDSYGTRDSGYRALVETMEELGIPVSRRLAPPAPQSGTKQTIVFLDPDARLVATGPKYLTALRAWVEAGGRVVMTPSMRQKMFGTTVPALVDEEHRDILESLGIDEHVSAGDTVHDDTEDDVKEEDFTELNRRSANSGTSDDDEDLNFWGLRRREPVEPTEVELTLSGSLESLSDDIGTLAMPGDGMYTLVAKDDSLAGSVKYPGADGDDHLIVAVLELGDGEIVVISDPVIFTNSLIARADNSVLAIELLAPRGEKVVFDEFYHGLAVRGNALYLLTRPGFAAVTVALLALVGVWTWRSAVFLGPPLPDTQASRRDIREYVSAMAEFFSRGQGSRRFILQEIRDGVLRQVCNELKLPMDTAELDTITSALARRDRKRAEQLASAVRETDTMLSRGGECPRSTFVPVMQRLANCL